MAATQPAALTPTVKLNPAGQSSAPAKPRFESIDGLRGLACLMVLLYHSCVHFGNIPSPILHLGGLRLTQAHIFAYGYGGVDLFFVLSGFCLAYPIVSRPDRSVDWKQYAINRCRRILPPYWAALMLFGVMSLWLKHHHVLEAAGLGLPSWPGLRQVAYSATLISTSFNSSFWTLPLEWRWYFVLPLLILLWRRIGAFSVLLCLIPISAVSIFLFTPSHLVRLQFLITGLPTFMPLFGLGLWAATLASGRERFVWETSLKKWVVAGVFVTIFTVLFFAPSGSNPTEVGAVRRLLTWGPLCFFLTLAATQEGKIRNILSSRFLVFVGTFSYSLYLTHEPFIRAVSGYALEHHWPVGMLLLTQIIILPALLIGFGYLFFLVAEKPFLRRPVKRAIEAEQALLRAAPKSTTAG